MAFTSAARPLAMSFSNRAHGPSGIEEHACRVLRQRNVIHLAQEDLPFGGAEPMAGPLSRRGIRHFSKLTPVFRQSRFNGWLFLPPYKPRVAKMLQLMKRF